MRGREQFYKYQNILNVFVKLFSLLPKKITSIVWSLISIFRGKIAMALRYAILKNITKSCGDVILIGPHVEIFHPENLSIKSNVSIQRGCYIDAEGVIEIGSNVSIAHNSSILSSEHTWEEATLPIRENPMKRKKVLIDDDVWIGCGSRILGGVHIKSRVVIGAGAVVNKSLNGKSVYAGVPAKKIRGIK